MQLPFQHHVDFVVVQGPRKEGVLPLHETSGHTAAVVSGHEISQAYAVRLCAVETTKLDAAAINNFDAAFAGHRFKARLQCTLFQRLFFLHHFFHFVYREECSLLKRLRRPYHSPLHPLWVR